MHRREFNAKSILALLGGVVVTVTGCGDSESPTTPTSTGGTSPGGPPASPAPMNPGDLSGVVSANHGHVAVVTGAQLAASNSIVVDITGGADHPHRVELSEAELGQIASGGRVSKVSSTDFSHNHTVTFN